MKKKIQLVKSGISLVDTTWGGFYRGGTYLTIGPRKSGKTLLGLQYAMECARQKEVCLFFTSMRPKDLMIHAASIDFDLQHYMNQDLIIVVRVAPPTDLHNMKSPDDFLGEYLNDIVTVVDQYEPNKIVFDELTPFVGFNDIGLLNRTFTGTCERIEDKGITSVFILGEPATPVAENIVETLTANVTGIMHLKKEEEKETGMRGGKLVITPNIGHAEGKFSANYTIEPYKGITVEIIPEDNSRSTKPQTEESERKPSVKDRKKYKSFADIEIPEEGYSFSNFYGLNDFNLILNNQIALYKSTGQLFTLISFKLNREAEKRELLTVTQLQNAIRLATDKKDKICVLSNKVIVLVSKEDKKTITSLISKVKANLPSNEPDYIKEVVKYISVYATKVNKSVENAEDMLDELMTDEPEVKNNYRFS